MNDLKTATDAAGVTLEQIDWAKYPETLLDGTSAPDFWTQDEFEIGYAKTSMNQMHVVFDSPRNRGLNPYPEAEIVGKDFGFVSKGPVAIESGNTLDSFGNLEVTPPFEVGEKKYPLGRIIIGVAFDKMHKNILEFLNAQKIQTPIITVTNQSHI